MATNFPGSLDSFTNPTSADTLDNPPHDQQHADVNDAVEALQAKVGVDGSAVTSSLDYKVANQGLVLVKSQTIGSGVSSVTVTDAFSSTFDNYRIMVNGTLGSVSLSLGIRFGAVASGYEYSTVIVNTVGTVSGNASNSASEIKQLGVCSATAPLQTSFDVFSPYLSTLTAVAGNGIDVRSNQGAMRYTAGFLSSATSFTSFVLVPSSGTMTGGTIRVYGYNDG